MQPSELSAPHDIPHETQQFASEAALTPPGPTADLPAPPSATKPGEQRRRRGAPKNNLNAIRHGMTVLKPPKGGGHVKKLNNTFRRAVEAALVADHQVIDFTASCLVNRAARGEMAAGLAALWLRNASDELTHDQRLTYLTAIVRHTEARDRALTQLGLTGRGVEGRAIKMLDVILPPEHFGQNADREGKADTVDGLGDESQA